MMATELHDLTSVIVVIQYALVLGKSAFWIGRQNAGVEIFFQKFRIRQRLVRICLFSLDNVPGRSPVVEPRYHLQHIVQFHKFFPRKMITLSIGSRTTLNQSGFQL